MIGHDARVLFVGTGTKTGKTAAFGIWTGQGILAHESCLWVGPWFARSRAGFEVVKGLLKPLMDRGEVSVHESLLRIRSKHGGQCDFASGDNPESLFGGNYHRVVIDEASRQPEKVFVAAQTTTSATKGQIRLAFNLELGAKNWAIRNLLRVQAMTLEERKASGEDFMTFPTDPALVAPELIEVMRSAMPEALWRAQYLAEIPESDVSLFRNLDQVFVGTELVGPKPGRAYLMGCDVARKRDYTVATVMDQETGEVVSHVRFNEISWSLQYARVAQLYKQFSCAKAWVDESGLGDPVCEELRKLGMNVEDIVFSAQSRKVLIEELVVACDSARIQLPGTEAFKVYRREMESFEVSFDGAGVKYSAPANPHDDCVMSLALCVHGLKAGNCYGWASEAARRWIQSGRPESFTQTWLDAGKFVDADVIVPSAMSSELSPADLARFAGEDQKAGYSGSRIFGQEKQLYRELGRVSLPAKKAVRMDCPRCSAAMSSYGASGITRCNVCNFQKF